MVLKEIEIELNRPILRELKRVAAKLDVRWTDAISPCLANGYRAIYEIVRKWEETGDEKSQEEHDCLSLQIQEIRAKLMRLSSKSASLNFDSFEAFNRVGVKVRSYSGYRAMAKDLQKDLEKTGIRYDISTGELAGFDELADRYLFRRERQKKDNPL
jgi:hypothetical protein